MTAWTRDNTRDWVGQIEHRIEDLNYYLSQTVKYCEDNEIFHDEAVFTLTFVTVLWVCHMRDEPITRHEIFEILGLNGWENNDDAIFDLGSKLGNLDYEDMLDLVARSISKY